MSKATADRTLMSAVFEGFVAGLFANLAGEALRGPLQAVRSRLADRRNQKGLSEIAEAAWREALTAVEVTGPDWELLDFLSGPRGIAEYRKLFTAYGEPDCRWLAEQYRTLCTVPPPDPFPLISEFSNRLEHRLREGITEYEPIALRRDEVRSARAIRHLDKALRKPVPAARVDERHAVEKFVYNYLGSAEKPAPFGGRDTALEQLDDWHDAESSKPYLVLCGEAGRGKSALLTQWAAIRALGDGVTLVFVPISIRFRTNKPQQFLGMLASGLTRLHGEEIGTINGRWPDADDLRSRCADFLSRPPPDGQRLLVLIDGLDEATEHDWGIGLFPVAPPERTRILITARTVDAEGAETWRRRLELPPQAVEMLPLPGLSHDGVADVVHRLGIGREALDPAFIDQLYRLSDEGDPLLVGLYAEDIRDGRIRPPELNAVASGLAGYLKRWWEEQQKLWRDRGQPVPPIAEGLRSILAIARAPLAEHELYAIAARITDISQDDFEASLEAMARLLVREADERISFSHPRFAYYFSDKLYDGRKIYEHLFFDWCVAEFEREQSSNHLEASPYCARYLIDHLIAAGAGLDASEPFVRGAWWRVQDRLGEPENFLNDMTRLREYALPASARAAPPTEAEWGLAANTAVAESCARSINFAIPDPLLVACLRVNILLAHHVLNIAMLKQSGGLVSDVAEVLGAKKDSRGLQHALTVARAIGAEDDRARALGGLAPALAQAGMQAELREALTAARAIGAEDDRARVLGELAPALAQAGMQAEQKQVLREALTAARAIGAEHDRAVALGGLAPALAQAGMQAEQKQVLREALTAARAIGAEGHRALVLGGLAPALAQAGMQAEQKQVLREALTAARAIGAEGHRALVLGELAPALAQAGMQAEQKQVLREALTAARAIGAEHDRAVALGGLAPGLAQAGMQAELREALTAARAIGAEGHRARALGAFLEPIVDLHDRCGANLANQMISSDINLTTILPSQASSRERFLTILDEDTLARHLPTELHTLRKYPLRAWILKAEALADLACHAGIDVPQLALARAISEIPASW